MARLRLVFAAALAASALVVLAVPASASVPAANGKFCQAVTKIGDTTASQPTKEQAKTLVKQFNTAAKSAPKKVKSAIGKITKYLKVLSGGDLNDLADMAKSDDYKGYAQAITTYSTYVATNCT
jgi:hypothetical protein